MDRHTRRRTGAPMLSAPTTARETFDLLGRLSLASSLDQLLDLIDWREVTPGQLYHAVLSRTPESSANAIAPAGYSARQHFREMLASREFQSGVVDSYIKAFPERRRLIFVHIPKCAGTHLVHHMSRYFAHFSLDHTHSGWVSSEELLLHLARTAVWGLSSRNLFIHGHFSLRIALDRFYRHGDQVFTVVREPRAVVLSQINYVAHQLRSNPDRSRPDTAYWGARLNRPVPGPDAAASEWKALALEVLHNTEITRPNWLCTFLGAGTFQSTQETLSLAPVELVDFDRYDEWLERRWSIQSGSRLNEGVAVLRWEDLQAGDRRHIDEITVDDRKFYERFKGTVNAAGTASVSGRAIWEGSGSANARS
jgi:hypothetical protein